MVWFCMFTYPIRPPLSQRTNDCARSWGDSEAARLPALPLQALLPLPLPGRPGLAYLLISPRPEAPGWRRRSSLEVDEAKPPSLTTTDVDSDSSNRPPPPGWPLSTQGRRGSPTLPLCFGLAEVHTRLPSRSSSPVYPANSRRLHTGI